MSEESTEGLIGCALVIVIFILPMIIYLQIEATKNDRLRSGGMTICDRIKQKLCRHDWYRGAKVWDAFNGQEYSWRCLKCDKFVFSKNKPGDRMDA
jgi:hypothetical protein